LWIRAVENEVCDAVDKGFRLAGTRARDDQKRRRRPATADAEFDRSPLAFVQIHKVTTLRSMAQNALSTRS
jgi:hypothetical protein